MYIKREQKSVNKYDGLTHSDIFNYVVNDVRIPPKKGTISFV